MDWEIEVERAKASVTWDWPGARIAWAPRAETDWRWHWRAKTNLRLTRPHTPTISNTFASNQYTGKEFRGKKNKSIFFYSFPFYFLSAIECVEHFPSQMRLVSNSTAIAFYIVFLYSEMNFWHRSVHIIVERDLFSYLMSSTYSNISISRQEIEKVRLINFDFATYLNAMSTPKKWIGSIARSKLPAARWVGVDPWCSWRCVGS